MQLVLALPREWRSVSPEHGKEIVTAPNGAVVDIDVLIPVPDDARIWIEGSLSRDAPAGAELRDVMPVLARNELGWPMEVYTASLVDPSGALVEARLGAFYKFQEYATHALARAKSPELLEELRATLIAAFRSGRPSWAGPTYVASLSELWT